MKPTTAKHFEVFQKEVLYWINKWGLHQWEIAFTHKLLDGNIRASISYNQSGRVCTLFLNSEWDCDIRPPTNAEMKVSAKHEAIELLLADVHAIGKSRWVTEDELVAAHHALVRRLEKLLQ